MELLAPIKNLDAGILAINLGADALFSSGPAFSARHNASMSFDDLKKLVEYTHIYNKKIYITLNTLIFESMFTNIKEYVNKLVSIGIDALIIQDIGLLNYLSKAYPNLEIHASTQMHIHNSLAMNLLYQYGIIRVVLARELSLEQLKQIKSNSNKMEIETFIHGALCTSYSGQCLYGAFYHKGSGNLGTCEQNCRKKHSFNNEANAMLSLKDLALQESVLDLVNISDSLKIEGRLKSKEYLYASIRYYQSILNNNPDLAMFDLLQIAFNREYSKARLIRNEFDLTRSKRINNHGLYIGEIDKISSSKIWIKTNKVLTRLDNIRIVRDNKEDGQVIENIDTYKNGYVINNRKRISKVVKYT